MKVLYADHTGELGGAEHSLLDSLGALLPDVSPVLACPAGPFAERAVALGVAHEPLTGTAASFRLHPRHTPRALRELGRMARELRRLVERHRPDVVHANSPRAGLAALAACARGGPPVVVHVRDLLPGGPAGRGIAFVLRTRAQAAIAVSDAVAASLGGRGPRVEVVYDGVGLVGAARPPLSVDEARNRLGLGEAGPVVAVIGYLTPWKGQDDAIRAVAALRGRWPDVRLLLVGESKFVAPGHRFDNRGFRTGLDALVRELDASATVRFLGERSDVAEILRAVDVVLVPSWAEPFGRTVVEAWSAGLPVIATRNGGPAEVVADGVTGRLLAPRDPAAWAVALGELLADPATRAAMGEAGRAAAGRFAPARNGEALLAVYRRLLTP